MGHNSPEGIFLGQELLLAFATWLNLTLNADNTITVYQLSSKFQNTFWFFKTCWWRTGLSRLYDASQPPGRHTRYFKTMLKILADRALMWHISFLFDGISFDARSIHVLCSRHNNWCKQSVPRFPLYMLWDLILTSYTINSLPVCCSTNKLLKTWLGKAKFFAYVLTRKQSKNQRQRYRATFFCCIGDHMRNFSWFGAEGGRAAKIVTCPLLWLASSYVHGTKNNHNLPVMYTIK